VNNKNERGVRLRAVGTYILSDYRSEGVAQKLWAQAIKRMKAKQVEVVITSRGGARLVNALRKKYKKIDWRVIRNTY
jgi:predicted GNAT family acetyltransferase